MAEIDDATLKKVEKMLNDTIGGCLWEPCGDPSRHELNAAARCFEVLTMLGLKVEDKHGEIRSTLEGNNICNMNFIKGL